MQSISESARPVGVTIGNRSPLTRAFQSLLLCFVLVCMKARGFGHQRSQDAWVRLHKRSLCTHANHAKLIDDRSEESGTNPWILPIRDGDGQVMHEGWFR